MIKEKRISFGSSIANIHAVNQFVEDICDHYNIFNSYFGNILTAVTEAVQNAITHGNHKDASKKITILFTNRTDGLSFTITDEGNGFNPETLPDPTDLNNDGSKGRGLFLMKSLSDEMTFLDGGRTVELFFNITGIDQDLAFGRVEQLNKYFQTVKQFTGKASAQ
jgi:serine/threonine-protein kinase RsbW